jgi:hypothetical protein
MDRVLREDGKTPELYRPVVAIGHTKDLVDPQAVDKFLSYLHESAISVGTFEDAYRKTSPEKSRSEARMIGASEVCK